MCVSACARVHVCTHMNEINWHGYGKHDNTKASIPLKLLSHN